MLGDCLIACVVTVFTAVGWYKGLVRSWTVPISMALATLVSQLIYVDVAAALSQMLYVEPGVAISIAYVFSWLALSECCDIVLSKVIKIADSSLPMYSKWSGGAIGLAKGFCPFVLAAMVASAQSKIPEPNKISEANSWLIQSAESSFLLPKIQLIAKSLEQPIGKSVLSDSAPHIDPNLDLGADPFAEIIEKQKSKGLNMAEKVNKAKKVMQESKNSLEKIEPDSADTKKE